MGRVVLDSSQSKIMAVCWHSMSAKGARSSAASRHSNVSMGKALVHQCRLSEHKATAWICKGYA